MNIIQNLKLKYKIFSLIIIILLGTLIPVFVITYNGSMRMATKAAIIDAKNNAKILNMYFDLQQEYLLKACSLISIRNVPRKAIENRNFSILTEESIPKAINSNTDIFIILDSNRRIIGDKNNSFINGNKLYSFSNLLDKTLKTGKPVVSYEIMHAQDIKNESNDLYSQVRIKKIPTVGANEIEENKEIEDDALVHVAASTINSQFNKRKMIGYVIAGSILNNNFSMLDNLKGDNENIALTIFKDDLRISTTIKTQEGERAVGTLLSKKLTKKIIVNGQNYEGAAMVLDKKFIAYYSPLKDITGKNIGGLFSAVLEKSVSKGYVAIFWTSFAITMLIVIAIITPLIILVTNLISEEEEKESNKKLQEFSSHRNTRTDHN